MADDDTDTDTESTADRQESDDAGESKPEGKKDNGKEEGKGKDDKKPDDKKDDEQERRDQFAEAAGDPLADALGGSSSRAGESQAYRSWIRTVRASAAAFVGGGNIGVLNITTGSGSADRRGQAPGPVRSEVLTELVNRYVPPAGYDEFVTRLSSTRLLVLRGAPGTGRTATGLRLLARLADSVARFGPDTDLRALTTADLEPQSGYLHELSPGSVPAGARRGGPAA